MQTISSLVWTIEIFWIDSKLISKTYSKFEGTYPLDSFESISRKIYPTEECSSPKNKWWKTDQLIRHVHSTPEHYSSWPEQTSSSKQGLEKRGRDDWTAFSLSRCCRLFSTWHRLALSSRPYLSYAVGQVAKHCHDPNSMDWEAVTKIFTYLKGTKNLGIWLGGKLNGITGFSDADFDTLMTGAQRPAPSSSFKAGMSPDQARGRRALPYLQRKPNMFQNVRQPKRSMAKMHTPGLNRWRAVSPNILRQPRCR